MSEPELSMSMFASRADYDAARIEAWALEAGLECNDAMGYETLHHGVWLATDTAELGRFATLVRRAALEEMREEAARVCATYLTPSSDYDTASEIAACIRALPVEKP